MNFQTTFLGRNITNIISAHARTTLSEASIHKKDENDVLKLIPDECKNHSKCFASFILHRRTTFYGVHKYTRRMHQRYFYSLRGVILRQQKEVMGSGLENKFKSHAKEHSGHGNNFFFYFIFYFTTLFFFNPPFFALSCCKSLFSP